MVNLCLSASGLSSHQQIPQEIVQQHCPKSKCQYKESKHLSDSIRMTKTTGSSTWAILKCTKQQENLPKLAPLNSVEVWLLLPPIKGTPMIGNHNLECQSSPPPTPILRIYTLYPIVNFTLTQTSSTQQRRQGLLTLYHIGIKVDDLLPRPGGHELEAFPAKVHG